MVVFSNSRAYGDAVRVLTFKADVMSELLGAPERAISARRWVLVLTAAAAFMVALDTLVVTTSLTSIGRDLGASIESLEWTANAYNVSLAVLLMTGAALGERLGRRRVYVAGLLVFGGASAACAMAPDVGTLIAARAVQGAGAALVMPVSLTLLSTAFPAEKRGRAMGALSGLAGLATMFGPLVGGAVSQGLDWRWIFWINVPVAVAVAFLTRARIAESRGSASFDLGGLLLMGGAALAAMWVLARGNVAGWSSPEVMASTTAVVTLFVAFIVRERRTAAPALPLRFFRARAFTAANLANIALWGSLYGFLFVTAQYFQVGLGYGPLDAGLRLMACTSALIVVAPLVGSLSDRIGERWFVVSGLVLQAVGMGWLALIADTDTHFAAMVAPLVVGGVGVSMAIPPAQRAAIAAVAPSEIGQASGVFTTLRVFGGAFGIAAVVAVFAGAGSTTTPQSFVSGFTPALGVAAVLALGGSLAALWIPGRQQTGAATRSGAPAIEHTTGAHR